MADKKLMVDSTILIDYFRKTDKTNSRLVSHFKNYIKRYTTIPQNIFTTSFLLDSGNTFSIVSFPLLMVASTVV